MRSTPRRAGSDAEPVRPMQVYLPDSLVVWVKQQAAHEHRSMSALVQSALVAYRASLRTTTRGLHARDDR